MKLLAASLMAALVGFAPASTAVDSTALVSVTLHRTRVDHEPGPLHVGAATVRRYLIYNRAITSRAFGTAVELCTYVGKGGSLGDGAEFCQVSYRMPKGRIETRGLVKSRFFYEQSVCCGTGFYEGVSGNATLLRVRDREWRVLMRLQFPE